MRTLFRKAEMQRQALECTMEELVFDQNANLPLSGVVGLHTAAVIAHSRTHTHTHYTSRHSPYTFRMTSFIGYLHSSSIPQFSSPPKLPDVIFARMRNYSWARDYIVIEWLYRLGIISKRAKSTRQHCRRAFSRIDATGCEGFAICELLAVSLTHYFANLTSHCNALSQRE